MIKYTDESKKKIVLTAGSDTSDIKFEEINGIISDPKRMYYTFQKPLLCAILNVINNMFPYMLPH